MPKDNWARAIDAHDAARASFALSAGPARGVTLNRNVCITLVNEVVPSAFLLIGVCVNWLLIILGPVDQARGACVARARVWGGATFTAPL